jgi:hypothetical protein
MLDKINIALICLLLSHKLPIKCLGHAGYNLPLSSRYSFQRTLLTIIHLICFFFLSRKLLFLGTKEF